MLNKLTKCVKESFNYLLICLLLICIEYAYAEE